MTSKRLSAVFFVLYFTVGGLLNASNAYAEYTLRFDRFPGPSGVDRSSSRGVQPVVIRNNSRETVTAYSASYALLVGVSEYSYWDSLPGVVDELVEVEEALEQHGFQVESVMNPDSRALRNAFEDFIFRHGFDYDARLLIFFAGHGHSAELRDERQVGFLVPRDAPVPDANDEMSKLEFRRKAFSMERFNYLARRIEAKHALFVFDSCFAGTVFGHLERGIPDYTAEDLARPVRFFIAAGTEEQTVSDDSLFGEKFVAALRGAADTNDDGIIMADQLGAFLRTEVAYLTDETQVPQYGPLKDRRLGGGRYVFGMQTAPQSSLSTTHGSAEDSDTDSLLDRWISSGRIPEDFVTHYLPSNRDEPLARVLQKADELTKANNADGFEYRQHAWEESTDAENLQIGIDTSRAIWFAFTRSSVPYTDEGQYITTRDMADAAGPMNHSFDVCDSDLRTGDVLVYRSEEHGDGHTVMVVDPKRRIAWGAHGWDGYAKLGEDREPDTGVEYQENYLLL